MIALWEAALWGAFGGVALELIELLGAVKRVQRLPWHEPGEASPAAFAMSVLIRLVLGVILAGALAQSGQVSGAVGALAAGVAAPLVLEQLGRQFGATTNEPPEMDPHAGRGGVGALEKADEPGADAFGGDGGLAGDGDPDDGGPANGRQLAGRRRPWDDGPGGMDHRAWSRRPLADDDSGEGPRAARGQFRRPVVSGIRSVWRAVVRSTPAFGGRDDQSFHGQRDASAVEP